MIFTWMNLKLLKPETPKKYKIVFEGKIKELENIDEVKKSLVILYKGKESTVEKLFLSKRVILKSNLSKPQAKKYKLYFDGSGAICNIEEM